MLVLIRCKEMHHPTHGVLLTKHVDGGSGGNKWFKGHEENSDDGWMENAKGYESEEEDMKKIRKFFVSTAPKSPMTANVCDLLVSLNIALNSYHAILCDFD